MAYFNKKNNIGCIRGFTLVELMVTVTIMMIMTGVVFFNYGKFNESSLMNQVAYDLSLTIRQAQVYGVATREGASSQKTPISITNAGSGAFQSAYGVHFDTASPKQFILFIDAPTEPVEGKLVGDGVYDVKDGPPLQTYNFQRGINIRKLCFKPNQGGSDNCQNGPNGIPGSTGKESNNFLNITFKRPDPEAIIMVPSSNKPVSSATIYLQNADGTLIKSVNVYSTGQISVQ